MSRLGTRWSASAWRRRHMNKTHRKGKRMAKRVERRWQRRLGKRLTSA